MNGQIGRTRALLSSMKEHVVINSIRSCLKRFGVVAALSVLLPASHLSGQAREWELPAEDQVKLTLHVNGTAAEASDENPGTEELPFKTIAAAAKLALEKVKEGVGTRVLIAPGTYRERVTLRFSPEEAEQITVPLVLEAAEIGKTIISGSDVWDGWERKEGTDIYTHHWPYEWGLSDNPWPGRVSLKDIVRRREMIFINGEPLKQVLEESELRPGTFHVSEEKKVASIYPLEGTDIENATIEVAVRDNLFGAINQRNLVIRGLVLQHAIGPVQSNAMNIRRCQNVLMEDCTFRWNNWGGAGLGQSSQICYRRNVSVHNGATGMGGWQITDLLWEDNETSYNNWRGISGGFDNWATQGVKLMYVHYGTIRRHRAVGNQSHGFWFDTDIRHVVAENCYWSHNRRAGTFIEACHGPLIVRNTVCANNNQGVLGANSANITLENCVIYGNKSAQLVMSGRRDRAEKNFITGEVSVINMDNWTLRGNTVVATGPASQLFTVSAQASPEFLATFKADNNIYHHPEAGRGFSIGSGAITLEMWQAVTGQDLTSFAVGRRGATAPPTGATVEALEQVVLKQRDDNWADTYPLTQGVSEGQWHQVDLSSFANRAFTGPNGWLGRNGALHHMPRGIQRIHGVPFQIIEDEQAAILLATNRISKTEERDDPLSVTVPVGQKVQAMYVLHAAAWATEHEKIGQYTFQYTDGTQETVDIVTFGQGSEHYDIVHRLSRESNIQDWYPTMMQFDNEDARQVLIIDSDKPLNYNRYLYTLQWRNPHPDKEVQSVEISVNPDQDPALFVLAMTALKAQ